MRFRLTTIVVSLALCALAGSALAAESEQDIVNRYLKKTEKKYVKHTGWFNVQAQYNRMGRPTDFDKFTSYLNTQMSGGEFAGQYNAKSLGADMGMMVSKRIGWYVGGEYWLKNSQTVSGSVQYTPVGGSPSTLDNPKSEISVLGAYTGVQYYVFNPPQPSRESKGISAWVGGSVGYYSASWDMFAQYQNLNLSTAQPDGANATFKGNAPGFSFHLGMEYPIIKGLSFGADANYLYLNFSNVAWYNSTSQEVVASYDGTTEGRVDLTFSGFRGKVALRKYFSW